MGDGDQPAPEVHVRVLRQGFREARVHGHLEVHQLQEGPGRRRVQSEHRWCCHGAGYHPSSAGGRCHLNALFFVGWREARDGIGSSCGLTRESASFDVRMEKWGPGALSPWWKINSFT